MPINEFIDILMGVPTFVFVNNVYTRVNYLKVEIGISLVVNVNIYIIMSF